MPFLRSGHDPSPAAGNRSQEPPAHERSQPPGHRELLRRRQSQFQRRRRVQHSRCRHRGGSPSSIPMPLRQLLQLHRPARRGRGAYPARRQLDPARQRIRCWPAPAVPVPGTVGLHLRAALRQRRRFRRGHGGPCLRRLSRAHRQQRGAPDPGTGRGRRPGLPPRPVHANQCAGLRRAAQLLAVQHRRQPAEAGIPDPPAAGRRDVQLPGGTGQA
ncbi:hypothetical protein D3C81_1346120 [compost metagenome]